MRECLYQFRVLYPLASGFSHESIFLRGFLLLNGHGSHVNKEEAASFARANNLHFVCLPSHTTHFLQPPDRFFFSPSKFDVNKTSGTWIKNRPGRGLMKLAEAWGIGKKKAMHSEHAMSTR
jgi:hypothetical protein